MQPLAIWQTCVCRPTQCMVASNCIPQHLGLCWSRPPRLLPVSAASPSMDHKHRTVCQPILEHQIRLCAPSSVTSRPTCFSSSLRCCWQVGSAPFIRCRCVCFASSVPFTNIQTYLLTSFYNAWQIHRWQHTCSQWSRNTTNKYRLSWIKWLSSIHNKVWVS